MEILMPSPICLAEGVSTVNGCDIKPGSTANISLLSHTDVAYWDLTCYSTDDQQTIAAINSNITIDHLAQTATVVIPSTARGCALIFKSTVNRGVDLHGITQPTYSTTFAIFGIRSVGHRLIATKQTTEGNDTFGWIEDLNMILANDLYKNPDFGANQIDISGPVNCGSIVTTDITGYNYFDGYVCYSTREVDASVEVDDHMVIYSDFAVIITDATVRAPGYHFDEYLPQPTLGRMVMILNDTTYSVRVYGNASEYVNHSTYFDINPVENRNYGCTLVSDGTDWFLTHPYKAPVA